MLFTSVLTCLTLFSNSEEYSIWLQICYQKNSPQLCLEKLDLLIIINDYNH